MFLWTLGLLFYEIRVLQRFMLQQLFPDSLLSFSLCHSLYELWFSVRCHHKDLKYIFYFRLFSACPPHLNMHFRHIRIVAKSILALPCLSASQHVSVWLPLSRFLLNFVLETFILLKSKFS